MCVCSFYLNLDIPMYTYTPTELGNSNIWAQTDPFFTLRQCTPEPENGEGLGTGGEPMVGVQGPSPG